MSQKTKLGKKSAPKVNKEKIKKDFTKLLKDAENKYDSEVTILLRAIDEAERKGNAEKLKISKDISEAWIEYFDALDILVKKNAKKGDETAKASREFIADQVKFFKTLSKEIERKIKELKAKKIRKALEK